ncbi:MAG: TrkH family potassium uptake protein [Candidatus Cloacimonetes bacterium]|jgi:trk system potassium uptake protein TrkH|nr:TrkH family potassium uptake protein [Candidatus Cloacimonadota bacterium]MDD4805920.1 TrkH family potassium uptake protein [Candidatus Cloacimonadota bacterium]
MPSSSSSHYLKHIESVAYVLAGWSFLVLFLESIISHYVSYRSLEIVTALANILLLSLTILNNLFAPDKSSNNKVVVLDVAMLALGTVLFFYQVKFVIFFLLIRQTWFIVQYLLFRAFEGRLYQALTDNPPVSLMISFAFVILIGTVLLMLPAASVSGRVTPPVDALFTATSATCVTGLIVFDTGSYFSLFGQLVILALIQIGGLGIMTISTAFALIMGQRLTLKLESVMYSVMGKNTQFDLFQLIKSVVLVTAIIEISGAILLFFVFSASMNPAAAMYSSIFHSISAFCNAGFSLFQDSFISFGDNPLLNFTITSLIILGGLGFAVLIDLYRYVVKADKVRKLNLHSKIVLSASFILLLIGFVAIYWAEYHGAMGGFTISRRVMSSWFQSVTMRTAGFNTIDFSVINPATVLVSLALMFIGASPGSTGGGVKTTTFAVLLLSVSSMLRGRKELSLFNRKISLSNHREATSLITLAALIVFVVIFILLMVEGKAFDKIIFEAISAFGTVGLSMGITARLSIVGKLLITLLMYIGRIGPLTMIYALSLRKVQTRISFAEEKIAIG